MKKLAGVDTPQETQVKEIEWADKVKRASLPILKILQTDCNR